jgi:hypothetical protein
MRATDLDIEETPSSTIGRAVKATNECISGDTNQRIVLCQAFFD